MPRFIMRRRWADFFGPTIRYCPITNGCRSAITVVVPPWVSRAPKLRDPRVRSSPPRAIPFLAPLSDSILSWKWDSLLAKEINWGRRSPSHRPTTSCLASVCSMIGLRGISSHGSTSPWGLFCRRTLPRRFPPGLSPRRPSRHFGWPMNVLRKTLRPWATWRTKRIVAEGVSICIFRFPFRPQRCAHAIWLRMSWQRPICAMPIGRLRS